MIRAPAVERAITGPADDGPAGSVGTVTVSFEHFQRGDGPVLRPCMVLFLDVLGTADPRTPGEAQEHLERTVAALERARDWGDSDPADAHAYVSWFSDNLGYAIALDGADQDAVFGEIVEVAQQHHCALVQSGFVARGGITCGLFYAEENVLYGPALNDAVALEKATRMPRVALDSAAVDLAVRTMKVWGDGPAAMARHVLAVDGDTVFVHYLELLDWDEEEAPLSRVFLADHCALIVDNLAAQTGSVLDKYRWLAAYHDWFCDSFADPGYVAELRIGDASSLATSFNVFGHDIPVPPDQPAHGDPTRLRHG